VVLNKNLGPLISTDMTRCIHCTRCVRFGQEIAGVMELGMIGRGEHAEIITFVGKTVDSELSGNVIDLCPVGALTSKPFRYTARTWELARRKSVSPHDALGSNLVVQIKNDRVMRVVPLENEAINECWLSDKDRFSYEGLNSEDRLTKPLMKRDGSWHETDWQTALEHVVRELKRIHDRDGAEALGALVSPHATLEEMHLAQKLVRGLGADNIDFRLRQSDFTADGKDAPWLGMSIAEFGALDRVLVIGSFLRKDHPLLAHRLRQATKKGAQLSLLTCADEQLLMRVAHREIVPPSVLPGVLAQIVAAAAIGTGKAVPPALKETEPAAAAQVIAASLLSGERKGVFLGNLARQHPQASQLHALAQSLAELAGAKLGILTEAANSVGGYIARALPKNGGLNAKALLGADGAPPRKAYLLLHAEPVLDSATPATARGALAKAELVVAMTPFKSTASEHATVLLPVSPFTETAGTFVNCEGRAQSFTGVVPPLGDTRPAWKVLRVLGSMLGLEGFDFNAIHEVRTELPKDADIAAGMSNATMVDIVQPTLVPDGVERVTDVPIYFADPLVRRAVSLQKTADARAPVARANAATLARLKLAAGATARLRQGAGEAKLTVALDAGLPDGCLRVPAGHPATSSLDAMFGPITVEVV
jgi:NADH-quinone oxidoreductase subunit G